MKVLYHIGKRVDPDQPIEWQKYEGEEIIAKMIIRQGKKIEDTHLEEMEALWQQAKDL